MGFFEKLRSRSSGKAPPQHSPEDIERARALFAKPEISEEARARKYRSEAILQDENVRVNLFLPVIETEAEMKKRAKEEVAYRVMGLLAVAFKGVGMEQTKVDELIAGYGIKEHFTPEERAFIEDSNPTSQMSARFSWRFEAAWTLLWALSYVEKLSKPGTLCDPGKMMGFLTGHSASQFIAEARLRTPTDILNQADLTYRYDWAAVDARLKGRPDPEINGEITVERHHALNWLVGYNDAEWDDVTTDT